MLDWSRRYQDLPSWYLLFFLYHECIFLAGIIWINFLIIHLKICSINNSIVLYHQPVKMEKAEQTIRSIHSNIDWFIIIDICEEKWIDKI